MGTYDEGGGTYLRYCALRLLPFASLALGVVWLGLAAWSDPLRYQPRWFGAVITLVLWVSVVTVLNGVRAAISAWRAPLADEDESFEEYSLFTDVELREMSGRVSLRHLTQPPADRAPWLGGDTLLNALHAVLAMTATCLWIWLRGTVPDARDAGATGSALCAACLFITDSIGLRIRERILVMDDDWRGPSGDGGEPMPIVDDTDAYDVTSRRAA